MTPLWSPEVEARIRAGARNLDLQERPDEVIQCTRCVVTNQRPRIVFDGDGVCSACLYAERKHSGGKPWEWGIDWGAREVQLRTLLAQHRKDSGYDVIVPCSGGKDSAMVAHRLKHDYDMHPLCVLWEPFMYTDVGRRNIDAFKHAGFDVVSMAPNGLIHRKLARLAFEFYGDPFQPFVYGQLAWPMRAAVHFGVPLVMYGENGEAEYGGDPAANDMPCWSYREWERVYMKGAGVEKIVSLGIEFGALTHEEARDLSPFYQMPSRSELNGTAFDRAEPTEFHWFGYYRPWHPMENFYYACEHTGFEPNEERSECTYSKFASIDDKLDGLHFYMAFVKFGIGRCTSDASQQVRAGDITRDEALALVERYDGEFPKRHLTECLEYLGMDLNHLQTVIERFRAPWILRCFPEFSPDGTLEVFGKSPSLSA